MQRYLALFGIALLAFGAGCSDDDNDLVGPNEFEGGAVIAGKIVSSDGSLKQLQDCADVIISLNGVPANVDFDDDCEFVVTGVAPTEMLMLRVEIPALGVSGTIEIDDVAAGELIEIEVEATERRLSIDVLRRAHVDTAGNLPDVITRDDVHIRLGAGTFTQNLTVHGDDFVLVGEAGDNCLAPGWTELDGNVLVTGDDATFRNIAFTGDVTVTGRHVRFINSCINGHLVRFGVGSDLNNHGDDDDDDDRQGDDNDDQGGDDDDDDDDDDGDRRGHDDDD